MKQISLQLKRKIQNVDILNNNLEVQRIVLKIMLAILTALVLWYVLTLGNLVFNIVERKAMEKDALTLSNEVGNLELSYLSLSNSVDPAFSSSIGFKEIKATFATRKTLGSLKLAKNEI